MTPPATALELGLGMAPELPPQRRVTWSNWTLPPYNRWSFQRVQQMTRTSLVPRAPEPIELPIALGKLEHLTYRGADDTDRTIADMLERTWTDGIIVMHRGHVVLEEYANGMRPDTLHLMMSCSKSMTSSLAGIAHDEGLLDLGAIVTSYLPELQASAVGDATIQNLLDMQVGLHWDEDYEDLEGHWRDLEVASGWREPYDGYTLPLDQLNYMRTLDESSGPHGRVFHYQSILTDVLGLCVARALGQSFEAAFAERVWRPMGAEQPLVAIIDAGGYPAFEGGFNCALRDFARFAWLIASGGRALDGTQVVPQPWIEACRYPDQTLVDTFAASEYGASMPGQAYHNNWWVRDPKRGVIQALGIHGQTMFIDPARELIVAKFSSQPEHVDFDLAREQTLAFDAISATLSGAPS